MFDFDLAELYGVETRVLKQAIRRNIKRFEGDDFMFELTKDELSRSQFVILNKGRGSNLKYMPFAFTELGVAMLSSVLNSDRAIEINREIMRAFVVMRQYLISNTPAKELEELQKQVKYLQEDVESLNKDREGYEKQFDEIYLAIAELSVRNKTLRPRKPIGFVQEENQDS